MCAETIIYVIYRANKYKSCVKCKYCGRDIGCKMIKSVLFLSTISSWRDSKTCLRKFNSWKLENILFSFFFILKILQETFCRFSGRVFTPINNTSCRDNYSRTTFPNGTLQNPVMSNKQVIKLGVHLLLRAGNKAVKLRDTSAATHA